MSIDSAGLRDGTEFEQYVMRMRPRIQSPPRGKPGKRRAGGCLTRQELAWTFQPMIGNADSPQDLYAARLTKERPVVDLQLNNKVALVFGASAGLGAVIAETLAAEGARIALASLPSDSLTAAAERVGAITDAIAVPWDLADLSAIGPNIATVERQLGPIEMIVNMTGGPPPTPASGQRPEDWTRFFTSMVVSVIAITDAVLPGMRERRWGRIITNTSSGVVAPIPNLGLSNVLRSSLVAWSKTLPT